MGNLCKLLKLILALSPVTIATLPYLLNTVSVFTFTRAQRDFYTIIILCVESSHFITSYRVLATLHLTGFVFTSSHTQGIFLSQSLGKKNYQFLYIKTVLKIAK